MENYAKSIFDCPDYVSYLHAMVGPEGTRSGVRLAMARALRCHSSYLTKVLNSSANLSLEQAFELRTFFAMTAEEGEYFLLLVEKARAGTKALRGHFELKLENLRQQRLSLKARVPIRKTLSLEDQATYYGSWHYAAVHVALTIPELRTRSAIAGYFELSEKKVGQILQFLVSVGLARKEGEAFLTGQTELHLEGDSPNILKHHTNWKMRALLALDGPLESDLHYSGVVTLSRKSAEALRERLVKTIQESISYVKSSKNEEEVLCFSLDYFGLRRGGRG